MKNHSIQSRCYCFFVWNRDLKKYVPLPRYALSPRSKIRTKDNFICVPVERNLIY